MIQRYDIVTKTPKTPKISKAQIIKKALNHP